MDSHASPEAHRAGAFLDPVTSLFFDHVDGFVLPMARPELWAAISWEQKLEAYKQHLVTLPTLTLFQTTSRSNFRAEQQTIEERRLAVTEEAN
ncbi:Uu.00g107800.m01.CDS01 [Anthostomella pinea]|uniref:Uu.00g107800.m01.CDS01 n=1 Tax=Anthostomella pinea TaxID=933095 RepID=A0AAI8YDL2_9PEZI|nr:Uu.00g107800.m01.CDS01 [Anthostomella pinea]